MGKDEKEFKLGSGDQATADKYDAEFAKYKEKLKKGPIADRHITDWWCCVIFLIAIGGFLFLTYYGVSKGNPNVLTIGWDSDGNGCGWNETTKDYPYLYFPKAPDSTTLTQLKSGKFEDAMKIFNEGVCVKECPKEDGEVLCKQTSIMKNNKFYNGCVFQVTKNYLESGGASGAPSSTNLAVDFRYETTQFTGFCVPNVVDVEKSTVYTKEVVEQLMKGLQKYVLGETGTAWAFDIARTWPVLAVGSVTALIISYIYLFIIRCIGGLIIYLSILLIEAALIVGGWYTYQYRNEYEKDNDFYDYFTWGSYVIWGLAVVVLFAVCCCWGAIKLGIAVYKTTAQYVAANLRIFLLPLVSYLACVIFFGAWVWGYVYLWSIGNPEPRDDYPFLTEVKWDYKIRYAMWYQLFMLFWCNAFIIGVTQFIIGASACIWYFEANSDTGGRGAVGRGLSWAMKYHLGSVAFGSAIIAACQLIRVIFEYYRRKMGTLEKNSKLFKVLMVATGYCLWLLENCVKYISKNAYIQVALTNNHFCTSAWNAFALIIKHAHRFGFGNSIGVMLSAFGILAIAAVNGLCAYFFITLTDTFEVSEPLAPVVALAVISGAIAMTFLSIFSFSSDAILQSFLLDEELRFQGDNRPEHMQEFAAEMEKKKNQCCGGSCLCC